IAADRANNAGCAMRSTMKYPKNRMKFAVSAAMKVNMPGTDPERCCAISRMDRLLHGFPLQAGQRAQREDRQDQHRPEEDGEFHPIIEEAAARKGTVGE